MRNFILFVISVALITSLLGTGAFASEKLPELKVAVNAEYEPFEYIGENGNLVGIDIEIMNEICSIMEMTPTFINMNFDEMIPTVRSPLADCAISTITPTETRKKVVDFTDSYLECKVFNPRLNTTTEEVYAISVKLTGEYKEQLNAAISQLKENGKIHEIATKYGLTKDSETGLYVYEIPEEELIVPEKEIIVSSWAGQSVNNAINSNWTSPNDFNYDYTKVITREQFCELAYNMLRDAIGVGTVNLADISFEDTENTKVLYLAQEGIISGKGQGMFAPNDGLTRAEAASILCRIAKYSGLTIPPYTGDVFSDDNQIADWARDTIYSAVSAKIMSGTGDGFSPLTAYTAEQAVSTIERLYNSIK